MKLTKNRYGKWEVSFRDPRTRNLCRRSLGTEDKAKAEALVKEAKIEQIEMAAEAKALTRDVIQSLTHGSCQNLGELEPYWEAWLGTVCSKNTTKVYSCFVKGMLSQACIERDPPDSLTEVVISGFVNKKGLSYQSRNMRLASARSFCKWMNLKGHISGNPAGLVKIRVADLNHRQREGKRVNPITHDEFSRLRSYLENHLLKPDRRSRKLRNRIRFLLLAMEVSWHTGLRLNDIIGLNWDSLNHEKSTVEVWTKKRDKRVAVPVPRSLMDKLDSLERLDEVLIFPREYGEFEIFGTKPSSDAFRYLVRKANFSGISFHSLRHAFVTRLKANGQTLEDIAKLVGHSTTTTTQGYCHEQED